MCACPVYLLVMVCKPPHATPCMVPVRSTCLGLVFGVWCLVFGNWHAPLCTGSCLVSASLRRHASTFPSASALRRHLCVCQARAVVDPNYSLNRFIVSSGQKLHQPPWLKRRSKKTTKAQRAQILYTPTCLCVCVCFWGEDAHRGSQIALPKPLAQDLVQSNRVERQERTVSLPVRITGAMQQRRAGAM